LKIKQIALCLCIDACLSGDVTKALQEKIIMLDVLRLYLSF